MPRPTRRPGESDLHYEERIQMEEIFRRATRIPDTENTPIDFMGFDGLNLQTARAAYSAYLSGVAETAEPERVETSEFTPNPRSGMFGANPGDVLERQLEVATRVLLRQSEAREEARRRAAPSVGRRENSYLELITQRNQENMSVIELLSSDMPVSFDSLSPVQMRELKSSGCPDIIISGTQFGWKCHTCHSRPAGEYTFLVNGHIYCALHVPDYDLCAGCRQLETGCLPFPQFGDSTALLCAACANGPRVCNDCSRLLTQDHYEVGLCDGCIDSDMGGGQRQFSRGRTWVSAELGQIIKSPRIFSCEIETATRSHASEMQVAYRIPKEAGVSGDSSINLEHGFEIQSPKLAGAKGEEFVQLTTAVLHEYKARVDESCGLHVHLDGKGIIAASRKVYPIELIQLWKTYLVFEDVTLSFLPYARRRNEFCRPMAEAFKLLELDSIGSLLDAEKLWYKERSYQDVSRAKGHHYHSSRYFGVNFHSLLSHGHLEIRYHSGTTNPRKILEWANLHSLIMDGAAQKFFTTDFLREAQATSSLKEKTEMLFDLIGLAKESRQYFRARQRKFADKKQVESTSTN